MDPPPEALLTTLLASHTYKYIYACKATLFIFDFIITFGDEVELIWSRWGPVELLYYAARYSAWPEVLMEIFLWFGPLDAYGCNTAAAYISTSLQFGMVLGQAIIVFRTWALWNGARSLQILFFVALIAILGVCVYIEIAWSTNTKFEQSSNVSPHLQGCYATSAYNEGYLPWLVFTCTDAFLLALTAAKALQHFRRGAMRLTAALYRDAFSYFSFMLLFATANILVWNLAPPQYQLLIVGFARIIYSTLACRIVLNLRVAAKSPELTNEQLTTDHQLNFRDVARDEETLAIDCDTHLELQNRQS